MIWFTSDLHFGHTNIIKHCNRPFDSVWEMDKTMLDRYNACVSDGDTVYILGDVCWRKPLIHKYLPQMKGEKHVILGNHDKGKADHLALYCKSVSDYKEVTVQSPENRLIVMSHYPFASWNRGHLDPDRRSYHLHGHSHGRHKPTKPNMMDVGVDTSDFYPYSIDEVFKIMSERNSE